MVRKNFEQCPTDIVVPIMKKKFVKIEKNVWKKTLIMGFGKGPKKKLTYKNRMIKNLEKQIKKAKKMGFTKCEQIRVGIGNCLYNCKIIYITEAGKIQVKYENGYNEIYSCKELKRMQDNGKYIIERDEKRRRRIFIYLGSYWTSDGNYLLNRYKIN